jgi:long-subunit acyl-CoA synthetase (AMP-forming)
MYFTAVDNLLKNSERYGNKNFLHQPIDRRWNCFTWKDVEQQARSIAAGLQEQGYEKNTKIGILSKNCAEWIIADLAIMMAGMISVPIYVTANRDTISYVIKHADIKAIFVGKLDDTVEAEAGIHNEILRIALPYPTITTQVGFTDWLTKHAPLTDVFKPAIDDIATIVYTSGSTGVPKGVILTHKNMAAVAQCLATTFNATSNDRAMSYLPLAHIVERSNSYVALYVALEVFFVESLDSFVEDLHYAKPTSFISVPRLWTIFQANVFSKMSSKKLKMLLSIPILGNVVARKIRSALGLQCSKWFVSGTAPIPLSLLQWYQALDIRISEGWGMTETAGASCVSYPFHQENLGTIGKPLDCVEMKLSSEGEILIRGDAIFSGYYLEGKNTADAFIDGWFCTGDCAKVDDQGVYKIIGRIKDKFKTSKGKYVAPVPIESLLCTNTDIEQVCIVGSGLKQPVGLIVLKASIESHNSDIESSLRDTLQWVNKQLEAHQKIDYLFICQEPWTIDNDLMTPTMKIKRNVIEEKYRNVVEIEYSSDVIWQSRIS